MTNSAASPTEQTMRKALPIMRLMLGYVPLPVMRWLQARGSVKVPDGITREVISADGVSCEWLIPDGSSADTVLLYLHGGGFVYGWTDTHRQMLSHLARLMGIRALAVDYRLAPEHPFPAPLEDCVTAYRWLLKQGVDAKHIVLAGDSAGGNLTLTTLIKLRDDGDPLPAAAACLSPAPDLTRSEESYGGFRDPVLHPRAAHSFRIAYVARNDPHHPLISPVHADLHGLPPLLIHTGEDEFLRDDAVHVAELARQAGVSVRVEVYPRMWHVWQIYLTMPQAVQSLEDIAQFLKAHVAANVAAPAAQPVS